MVSEARARRIARRIHEEAANLLQFEVADPRLKMVTVTGVEVDRELSYATLYVSAIDAGDRVESILSAFEGAKGFLRRELSARVELRTFPMLRFRWDDSPDRGARVDELLIRLSEEDEQKPGSEQG